MISSTHKRLNDVFDIETVEEVTPFQEQELEKEYALQTQVLEETVESEDAEIKDSISNDYDYARNNLKALIEYGEMIVELAIRSAQDTEDSKSIDSATKALNNLASLNEKLLALTTTKQDVYLKTRQKQGGSKFTETPTETPPVIQQVTNNTMFVGTNAELAKLIKQIKTEQKSGEIIDENTFTD